MSYEPIAKAIDCATASAAALTRIGGEACIPRRRCYLRMPEELADHRQALTGGHRGRREGVALGYRVCSDGPSQSMGKNRAERRP
jgi:hypothetical protein